MVLSHDIIEVVDKINGINIKMLSYIDFTNNYAEIERVKQS